MSLRALALQSLEQERQQAKVPGIEPECSTFRALGGGTWNKTNQATDNIGVSAFNALEQTEQAWNKTSDDFEERIAIIQANGIPEAWATGFSILCTMPRPTAYVPERWQQLVDDGGNFLDRWGRQAAALGWQAVDVFGVDPAMPDTVYRSMGLLPLLAGRMVCAITTDTARIDCGNGVTQSFRRHAISFGAVPLWNLERGQ